MQFVSPSALGLSLISGLTELLAGAVNQLQSLPANQTSEVSIILGVLLMHGIPLMSKLFEE
jgi:hypothetical protein